MVASSLDAEGGPTEEAKTVSEALAVEQRSDLHADGTTSRLRIFLPLDDALLGCKEGVQRDSAMELKQNSPRSSSPLLPATLDQISLALLPLSDSPKAEMDARVDCREGVGASSCSTGKGKCKATSCRAARGQQSKM